MKTAYMEGCGNSFFVVDTVGVDLSEREMAELHRQLNGKAPVDGVLFLGRSYSADVRMTYFDVDRQTRKLYRANMCGNGIRCLSRFARDGKYVDKEFNVETDDGIKAVSINGDGVTVNMGRVGGFQQISGTDFYVYVGVPHYVRFTDTLDPDYTREEGLRLKNDEELLRRLGNPEGILVFNSARRDGSGEISILTREGGVEDITLACGTGSVAAAYVGNRAGLLRFPVTVHNPGGDLVIHKNGDDQILMTGPADYMKTNQQERQRVRV